MSRKGMCLALQEEGAITVLTWFLACTVRVRPGARAGVEDGTFISIASMLTGVGVCMEGSGDEAPVATPNSTKVFPQHSACRHCNTGHDFHE